MLDYAARAMGYRVAILDPDPDCPAAAVADHVVIGSYDDVGAALRLADLSDVVTYELEHIAAEVVATLARHVPVRPGHRPLLVTQDRLAERRFIEDAGIAVAPWRAVRTLLAVRGENHIAARQPELQKASRREVSRRALSSARRLAAQHARAERCSRNFQKAYTFLTSFT